MALRRSESKSYHVDAPHLLFEGQTAGGIVRVPVQAKRSRRQEGRR